VKALANGWSIPATSAALGCADTPPPIPDEAGWVDSIPLIRASQVLPAAVILASPARNSARIVAVLTGLGGPERKDSTMTANGVPSWNRNPCPASG
jgi:hypothetical protein